MNTLSEMYLGSEPTSVRVQDDNLVLGLENGQELDIPLQLLSQFMGEHSLPAETEILVLRYPPKIDHVHVTDSALNVYLDDGRVLVCPLAWFPRLLHGTATERNHYELVGEEQAIHWPDLDEDIEVLRLFEGGKSTESASSIEHWLLSRHVASPTE